MTGSAEFTLTKGVAEKECRVVRLTGAPGSTYTPSRPQGGTVRVMACYDNDSAGDAVKVTTSANVLTIDAGGSTTTVYILTYYIE